MPRPSNTTERRSQIVSGLMQVMSEHGYDGASIQRVAKEAGLSPGLVHYHFKNKIEILIALLDQIGESLQQRFEECSGRARSAKGRLFAFIDAHLKLEGETDRKAVACWVIIGSEAIRNETIQEAYQSLMEKDLALLEQLVRDYLQEENRSTRKTRSITEGIMASIQGSYQLLFVTQSTFRKFDSAILKEMIHGMTLSCREVSS